MSDDINALARISYESGVDPIDFAEGDVAMLIEAHARVAVTRIFEPGSFPGYSVEMTIDALARRILGNLLDAGWQPPAWPIPEPEVSR